MLRFDTRYRVHGGQGGASYKIPHPRIDGYHIVAIASCGMGWEHVSVTLGSKKREVDRCPTWEEMCFVKDFFWDKEDPVMQFHPPASEYVNQHKHCLHLWRPLEQKITLPSTLLVGLKHPVTHE